MTIEKYWRLLHTLHLHRWLEKRDGCEGGAVSGTILLALTEI